MRLSGPDRRAPSAFSAARALRIILVSMASMGAACGVAGAQSDPLQLGASYLKDAQNSDGLFNYEFDFLSSKYSSKSNLVRQAGAGYGLAEYYVYSKDESVKDTIFASIRAYSALSIPWENGKLLTTDSLLKNARAGATALALLAELQYQEASGDQRGAEIRRYWVQGLLSLYRPGGGFEQHPGADRESNYFNGESWLALAYYNHLFPGDAAVAAVLKDLDAYLIRTNDEKPNVQFFHWGALAAAKRYEATGDKRFVEFASRQAIAFLDDLRPTVKSHANTCYSVEGLAAVAAMLEASQSFGDLRARIIDRVGREMEKNLRFQIEPEQDRIVLGDERYLYSDDIERFAGAFLNGLYRPKTRIDFTQHCLSAMVKYKKIGLDEPGPTVLGLQ